RSRRPLVIPVPADGRSVAQILLRFKSDPVRRDLLQGSPRVADKQVSMPRNSLSRADQKAVEISTKVYSEDFKVTPSMRRKVDDLAVWLAAGDRTKVKGATRAVIDLLCAAARVPA